MTDDSYVMCEEHAAQEATRCSGCSQAESGRCHYHRGPRHKSERERALQRALSRSVTALDDWLNTYASEFCDPDRVAAAGKRIMSQGGTLAYIADIQAENRKALDIELPTNGERIRAQGEDV